MWFWVEAVPIEVYQAGFFTGTVTLTSIPHLIWASQAYYVGLLGIFGNLMALAWIGWEHEEWVSKIAKWFSLGIPPEVIGCFWLCVYFTVGAYGWNSHVLGFFAAVACSGMFSFSMRYSVGTLWLNYSESLTGVVFWGNLGVCGAYTVAKQFPEYAPITALFSAGVEWYCAAGMGVALLVGASPWGEEKNRVWYIVLTLVLGGLASLGYFFGNIQALSTMIWAFSLLVGLEWLAYVGYSSGLIIGCGLGSATIYAVALLFERFGQYLIFPV